MNTTTTPTADESALILIDYLKRREPFFFIRYGDGALECIFDASKRKTCDGEVYTDELGRALMIAWARLSGSEATVFAGDWQSASFGGGSGNNYELDRWKALSDNVPFRWIHFEALLLMRESAALVDFYRTVRADRRRKVYMGPHAAAARLLRAFHLPTPMVPNLLEQREKLVAGLDAFEPEVVLFGAGMAGHVVAVDSWERDRSRTFISLGSALDPLFGNKSRSQQLGAAVLRKMFRGML
jgi:hypothetical protein